MHKTPQLYLLLFTLYWAQGLPVGFMTHALPVILRAQGVSLAHIGGFGLLMLPWGIKVLWAPLVDRYGLQQIGHYRSWILPAQFFSIVILIILSFLPIQALNQPVYLLAFFMALFLMNSTGATQDIATDGLAVRILKGDQQHWGNMLQVAGSRLGFIVGGGAILWVLDWLTWQTTFLLLAGMVSLNTIPLLFYREPHHFSPTDRARKASVPASFSVLVQSYLRYFLSSRTMLCWLVVLCTLKISDGLSGPIIKPLMVDLGLSLSQIGLYITMLGAAAALCGAGVASLILNYMQRAAALVIFSLCKLGSLAAFAVLAMQYEKGISVQPWLIYLVNALEDMFASMLLVVILTLVMQYSRSSHAGTDFTFQVSVMALVSGSLYTLSGIAGDQLGYQTYLWLIVMMATLCLLPIFMWKRSLAGSVMSEQDD
ncbi:MFS transporter [Acinetobacter sp. WZC-1]|uniref:MFS transporter n=1 Tax=Acinetobacter sp. WZC-1 TaxID=3459034 RepID=UPI00403D754E